MNNKSFPQFLISLTVCLCLSISLYGAPAFPGLVKIRQPNGYEFMGRMMGDEHHHWVESEDGYTLLYDQKGFLTVAKPDQDGDLQPSTLQFRKEQDRDINYQKELLQIKKHESFSVKQQEDVITKRKKASSRRRIIKPSSPVVGQRKFLVVMMEFPDKKFKHTQQEFYALMNEEGYTTDGNQGSVHDFYKENSFGQLDLISDVAGIYQAKHEMAYYGNNTNGHAAELAVEAMAAAAEDYDLTQYDSDGDGYIDGLHIIFSGYGEEAGGGEDCIWSHESTTSGYFCTYDGVKMNAYSCTPELRGAAGSGMSFIGVICHEIGHALGTPDFYDTNYATNGQYGGTGEWDVMGSGSWNNNGACPAHFNPYSKIYDFQWSDVQDGNRAMCAKLNAKTKGDFIRIDTQSDGEYFLLEYRHRSGFDSFIPGHGLMVWRATDDLSRRNSNTINAEHKQQFYPIAANSTSEIPNNTPSSYGITNSAATPFPGSMGITELTDESTPSMKSWKGIATEFPITDITEDLIGECVEFNINGGDYGAAYSFSVGDATRNSLKITWKVSQPTIRTMLICNTEDAFGNPTEQNYANGDQLDGGGEVIYIGTITEFIHTNLLEHTYYYYRVCTWQESTSTWKVSNTRIGRTKTGVIKTFPYIEKFDSQAIDEAWEEEIVFGNAKHWKIANPLTSWRNPSYNSSEWLLSFCSTEEFTHQQSRMILPGMDFSGAKCAVLSFDYRNWIHFAKVMYRTSQTSEWQLLKELDSHYRSTVGLDAKTQQNIFLNSETHIDILLPQLSEDYQVCIVGDYSTRGSSILPVEVMTIDNIQISIDEPSIARTYKVDRIGSTSAFVYFSTLEGTEKISESGVEYSTNGNSWTRIPIATSVCQLSGLSRNTTYFVRAYATTESGNSYYGDIKVFKTLPFSSGSGTKDAPILISSLDDWNLLRSAVSGGNECEGIYFALTTSLIISPDNVINGTFSGILDGRSNIIGCSVDGVVDYFIEYLGANGELHDLALTTGSLVYFNYGTIHHCQVNFNQDYSSDKFVNFGFIACRNYNVIYSCDVFAKSIYYKRGYVGGVCGWNFNMISMCSFDGIIKMNNNARAGGIAGANSNNGDITSSINQCINNGTIMVQTDNEGKAWFTNMGGIVGEMYGGVMDQCINNGTMLSGHTNNQEDFPNYVGGIVGRISHSSILSNCLNTGTVITEYNPGDKYGAGGIAGEGYLAEFKNCIMAGEVRSTTNFSENNHSVIGSNNQASVDHCFYIGDVSDSYATHLTSEQMADEQLVNDLNTNNGEKVWKKGSGHPKLISESSDYSFTFTSPTNITESSIILNGLILAPTGSRCAIEWREQDSDTWNIVETEAGKPLVVSLTELHPATMHEARLSATTVQEKKYSDSMNFATEFVNTGTADDPVIIQSLYALNVFRQTVHQGNQYSNQVVRLNTDINLQGDKGVLWEPITEGINGGFAGEFDGNGHVIRNMKVVSYAATAGFFGTTSKCYVHDLTILNGDITCYVGAPVVSSDFIYGYLGGIGGILGACISFTQDGKPLVERCSYTGTIVGGNCIGGIVGDAIANVVKDCYANASLHYLDDNEALIGGIAGMGNVENCYFTGIITAPNVESKKIGRIIGTKNGTNGNTYTVTNSYYQQSDEYTSNNLGNQLTESEMKDGTLLGKFNANIWTADNKAIPINDGYPILLSQSAPRLWIDDYKISGKTILSKGVFYGAERNYAIRGFEYCLNPKGENAKQVICESSNTFTAAIPYTEGQYIKFRAFARENESTTAYSEWVELVPEYVKGDANGDGTVDIADAVYIVNYVVGKPAPDFNEAAADVNEDGDIDIADAVQIINFVVGKITEL